MQRETVIIKTNAYGLTLILSPDISFEQLLEDTGRKFAQAARFFRNAQMALTFRGRELTTDEELALIEKITENAKIQIVCIVDEDKAHAARYEEVVTRTLQEHISDTCKIIRGSVMAGELVQEERSILILGDVKPGGRVVSAGNVIILGTCLGEVTAGAGGDERCFAAGIVLKPNTLRIAGVTAKSAITKRFDSGEYSADPKIAYLRDSHLVMESLKAANLAHYFDAAGEDSSKTET